MKDNETEWKGEGGRWKVEERRQETGNRRQESGDSRFAFYRLPFITQH